MKEYFDFVMYGAIKVVNTIGWHLYDIYYTSVDISIFGASEPNLLDTRPLESKIKIKDWGEKYKYLIKFIDQKNMHYLNELIPIDSSNYLFISRGINSKIMMRDKYDTKYLVKPMKKSLKKDTWVEAMSSDL